MNPITVQDLLEAGKHAAMTGNVLTEWAEKGTPNQHDYLHWVLVAEHESRLESRRQRLLKAARLPVGSCGEHCTPCSRRTTQIESIA